MTGSSGTSSVVPTNHLGFQEVEVKPASTTMATMKRPEDVASVDVYTAKGLLSIGHRYLDVRTIEEFNKSHVENAINIPYMLITEEGRVKNPEFLTQISSTLKKEDHLVVGCNSGGRALKACVDLLNEGFQHVTNMEGGYSSWVDSGLAGDKPSDELKVACKFRP